MDYIGSKDMVVYFTAPWCTACVEFFPLFEKLVGQRDIEIVKVNVMESTSIVASYGIRSIPMMLFFHEGEEKKVVGAQRVDHLEKLLEDLYG